MILAEIPRHRIREVCGGFIWWCNIYEVQSNRFGWKHLHSPSPMGTGGGQLHLESPQDRQVLHPSIMTTATVEHLLHI